MCERCLQAGRHRRAVVVNHKIPLAMGGTDLDANTENLCTDCDIEVTAEQFGHQARPSRGVSVSGRPTHPDHPWNRTVQV
jgi:hypothetical protein